MQVYTLTTYMTHAEEVTCAQLDDNVVLVEHWLRESALCGQAAPLLLIDVQAFVERR